MIYFKTTKVLQDFHNFTYHVQFVHVAVLAPNSPSSILIHIIGEASHQSVTNTDLHAYIKYMNNIFRSAQQNYYLFNAHLCNYIL